MLYQLSYASSFKNDCAAAIRFTAQPIQPPETISGSPNDARTHSRSAHITAQKLRLAYWKRWGKPALQLHLLQVEELP